MHPKLTANNLSVNISFKNITFNLQKLHNFRGKNCCTERMQHFLAVDKPAFGTAGLQACPCSWLLCHRHQSISAQQGRKHLEAHHCTHQSVCSYDLWTFLSLAASLKMCPGESKRTILWNVLSLQADRHNTYEEADLRKTSSLNSNITPQFLDFISMLFFQSISGFLHFCFLIFFPATERFRTVLLWHDEQPWQQIWIHIILCMDRMPCKAHTARCANLLRHISMTPSFWMTAPVWPGSAWHQDSVERA